MRAALRDDPTLWKLLDSPLLLSIVALAYKDKTPAKLRASGTSEERRKQLFNDYITAMFARRDNRTHYTQLQTVSWLSWLAIQMVKYNQTAYYIERMQPDWLPSDRQHSYSICVSLLIGLLGGLVGGLLYGGFTVLQHYTLRWLLYRNGSLPLRFVPFLDYCVERIFLRKVGGGYIFIHRLLMEHFASMNSEQQAVEPAKIETTP